MYHVQNTDEPLAKPGQKTLAELDRYRYTEAPALFSLDKPTRTMQLEDVKSLVEWKLYVRIHLTCSTVAHIGEDLPKALFYETSYSK